MTVVLFTAWITFELRLRVSPVILTRCSSCFPNACLGVVVVESDSAVCVSNEAGVFGVSGDALAVKNDVPVVDAMLNLCDVVGDVGDVDIGGGGKFNALIV